MPTDLASVLQRSIDSYRVMKERAVRTHGNDPAGMIEVYRNGAAVALATQPQGDGGAVAEMSRLAVALFRADAAVLMVDTYLHSGPIDTAPEWATIDGELGRRWRRGQHRGITEALTIEGMDAEGTHEAHTLAYIRKGRAITWGEIRLLDGPHLGGRLADAMRAGFAQAESYRAEVEALDAEFGVEPGAAAEMHDMRAVKVLQDLGCPIVAYQMELSSR